jgi:hypothetical protein
MRATPIATAAVAGSPVPPASVSAQLRVDHRRVIHDATAYRFDLVVAGASEDVTHIYHPENGEWKIVHRRGDPLCGDQSPPAPASIELGVRPYRQPSRNPVLTASEAARPGNLGVWLAVVVGCFAVLLWTATILSIFKPWGRTWWGRQDLARRRTTRSVRSEQVVLDA